MKKQNPLRGVLEEELRNSLRMLVRYKQELERLPKGALVAKRIKGHLFHYLARRQAGKVRFIYQGRMDAKALAEQQDVHEKRRQYRGLMAELRQQIKFLERALHERKKRAA